MNTEMEERIRELQALVTKGLRCRDAVEVMGGELRQAEMILDRMRYLIDTSYFSPMVQSVIQADVMRRP